MKKLMIAAAVAAMGAGAFAENCGPDPAQAVDEAWVYAWKFTGKTTVGTAKDTDVSTSCAPGKTTCVVRVPGKVTIQGYTYHCNPACADFAGIAADGQDDVFWATKPEKSLVTPMLAFTIANVMGKSKNQFEAFGQFDATLTELENEQFTLSFAGQGKYKGNHPTSISGYFAGFSDNTYYVAPKANDDGIKCFASQPWDCATLACAEASASAAWGTWSVKFNSSAAKKYAKNGTTIKIPSWVAARRAAAQN